MNRYLIRSFVITILLCIPLQAPEPATPEKELPFDAIVFDWSRTWAEVLQQVKERHYKIQNPQKGMVKGINEFLNHLDPHSAFLDPETYTKMLESTSGEFYGVGIVIDNTRKTKDKHITVVDIIADGPADKAGIEPGDKIVEVNGEALEGMATEEIIAKIKGERNTNVKLSIMREGYPDMLDFSVKRDKVQDQNTLSFHIKPHDIYYVSLSMFSKSAIDQIKKLLQKAQHHDYRGLIIDLRNNSGGLLDAVVDIASFFLPKGTLVAFTKDKDGTTIEEYHTTLSPIVTQAIPIFILINNYTASAAEILAGCLAMHSEKQVPTHKNRYTLQVFLVGTESYGKGSVQEIIPVSNNSAIKLTTYVYYLPNGETIQGVGIKPDFLVEKEFPPNKQLQWFTKYYGRESSHKNSIKIGAQADEKNNKTGKSEPDDDSDKPKRWQERAKEMLQKDNQLRATITLINMLSAAQKCCPKEITTRADAINYLKNIYLDNNAITIEEIP